MKSGLHIAQRNLIGKIFMSAVEKTKGDLNKRPTEIPELRPFASQPVPITINPRRFLKATKQLATLGPASNYIEMIEKLFLSGADMFRLNFSHGEHSEKAQLVNLIREVEAKYNRPIAILADLQVGFIPKVFIKYP